MTTHGLIAGTLAAAMILAWLIVLGGAPETEPPSKTTLGAEVLIAAVFTVLFFGWVLQ